MSSVQGSGQSGDEELLARLVVLDQPAEVTGAAGAWLAWGLRDDGFTWARSVAKLERRDGVRREQVHLQNSKWNRTGELAAAGVRDRPLAR